MKLSKAAYKKHVEKNSPGSHFLNTVKAFIIGGFICIIGQALSELFLSMNINKEESGMYVSVLLIFAGALLTGLNIYDEIGRFAGAGSIVPITGFANSVVSPAMEFRSEGLVFGTGSRMFLIAGPVIVYGLFTSFVFGLLYYFIKIL